MTPRKSLKHLEDVRDAASFIRQSTHNKTMEDYTNDRLLRQAVERNFEIIGEAMVRLRNEDPDLLGQLPEAKKIIAFRNILVHGYDVIDHSIVWDIIVNKLEGLIRSAEHHLKS